MTRMPRYGVASNDCIRLPKISVPFLTISTHRVPSAGSTSVTTAVVPALATAAGTNHPSGTLPIGSASKSWCRAAGSASPEAVGTVAVSTPAIRSMTGVFRMRVILSDTLPRSWLR